MAKKKEKKPVGDKILDFIADFRKKAEREIRVEADNRRDAVDCLYMLNGERYWDEKEKERRKLNGRPCLVLPLFPTFVNQQVGEMLHNRARAKIKPGDNKSSSNIAKIRSGIIANAEYRSNGDDIYMQAGKTQVACGYGAWQIKTRWCEENPFIQEYYLEFIPNPLNVYLDSRRKDESGLDAKFGFMQYSMTRSEFEDEWPDAEYPSGSLLSGTDLEDPLFYDKESITVVDYYVIKPEKVKMCLMKDGTVLPEDDVEEKIKEWEGKNAEYQRMAQEQAARLMSAPIQPQGALPSPSPALPVGANKQMPPAAVPPVPNNPTMTGQQQPAPVSPPGMTAGGLPLPPMSVPGGGNFPPKPEVVKKKDTEIKKVKHYTLTANQILGPKKSDGISDEDHKQSLLDGEDFPGEYIPIVQVLGITMNIKGKTYNKGLIRDARDAAKLVCYWESCLAETIALAPKAPWLLTPEQVQGFEEDYKNANVTNPPYMLYNPHEHSGTMVPPPMRQHPSDPPVALFTQASRAADNLRKVIGMFGQDIGEGGPERTGAAVYAKQKPSDVASYIYSYKLNRAIEYSAKVMNSMTSQIIDTERDVRLRNIDDTESIVPVNTTVKSALEKMRANPKAYNLDINRLQELYKRSPSAKLNDITAGKYEVIVTTGPSYATARQEASAQLMNLVNAVPAIGKLGGDIIVEPIDEKLAARIRKTLPKGLVALKDGEQPFQAPIPPQIRLMLQKEQTQQIIQKKENLKVQLEGLKIMKEMKSGDKDIEKRIYDVLEQLFAPPGDHPADQFTMQGMEE